MAISVQQGTTISLDGDGFSTSFAYDFTQVPVSLDFSVGTPSAVVAKIQSSPLVRTIPSGPEIPWNPNTTYSIYTKAFDILPTGRQVFVALNAGTSGGSVPSAFLINVPVGTTVQDNDITWIKPDVPKYDNATVTAAILQSVKKSIVNITFSQPLLQAGSQITDMFGNVLTIGPYVVGLTFYYNG